MKKTVSMNQIVLESIKVYFHQLDVHMQHVLFTIKEFYGKFIRRTACHAFLYISISKIHLKWTNIHLKFDHCSRVYIKWFQDTFNWGITYPHSRSCLVVEFISLSIIKLQYINSYFTVFIDTVCSFKVFRCRCTEILLIITRHVLLRY